MKILFISLGCDKNLADSEEMLGLLTAGGHDLGNFVLLKFPKLRSIATKLWRTVILFY